MLFLDGIYVNAGVGAFSCPVFKDPGVIKQILDHLDRRAGQQPLAFGLPAQATPQGELPGFEDLC